METKYEEIKEITAAAVYDAGDKTSDDFRVGFQKFLKVSWNRYTSSSLLHPQDQLYFFLPIWLEHITSYFEKYPEIPALFIKYGFIKEV